MIVTSFSQKGYHEYGKRFITTFLEHWPDEKLTVYYETGIPRSRPQDKRVSYVNLKQYTDFNNFENLMKSSDPLYQGHMRTPDDKVAYNFRFDANKFFRKVFCIAHASRQSKEKITWIDADVEFIEDIPEGFINSLLPDDQYLAHLGREWMYTEAGFMIFNCGHEAHNYFMPLYLNFYFTGAFKYLGEFHDCYVLDCLRKLLDVPCVNLNPNEKSNHPFQESEMGKYMQHYKGPERKEKGGLLETDPVHHSKRKTA